ncbi:MAG: type II toxin-antitoxin system Phd/YefM family antitoxin [Gammaproteobacteria bacterium]|nr:type II toxin-antitoxin system Phd/YefM family antitoxin [Gammaproteobacteria bacterium]
MLVMKMSKTEFKSHALEVFRSIEKTGEPLIITDHGKPKLEIRKLQSENTDALGKLKGSVVKYDSPTSPVAVDDWENI